MGDVLVTTSDIQTTRALEKANNISHIDDFGITGVGDETVLMQSWLDSLNNPNVFELVGKPIRVNISSLLTVPLKHNSLLRFAGVTLISTIVDGSFTIKNNPTVATLLATVVADTAHGDKTLTLSDTSELSVGDLIEVTGILVPTPIFDNYLTGDLARVVSISGTVVTLDTELYWGNLATDMTIKKWDYVENVEISGLGIELQAGDKWGMSFSALVNSEVMNNKVNAPGIGARYGIGVQVSSSVDITNNTVNNMNSGDTSSDYGIVISGNHINVERNNVANCKHNLTAGAREFCSKNLAYHNNVIGEARGGAIDYHYNVYNSSITDNYVDSSGFNIYVRGQGDYKINGNTLKSRGGAVITLACDEYNASIVQDIEILNNIIDSENSGGAGVIDMYDTLRINKLRIRGNIVDATDMVFVNCKNPSGMTNADISGNTVEAAGLTQNVSDTYIGQNKVTVLTGGTGVYQISADCVDVTLDGNTIVDDGAASRGVRTVAEGIINILSGIFKGWPDEASEIMLDGGTVKEGIIMSEHRV